MMWIQLFVKAYYFKPLTEQLYEHTQTLTRETTPTQGALLLDISFPLVLLLVENPKGKGLYLDDLQRLNTEPWLLPPQK